MDIRDLETIGILGVTGAGLFLLWRSGLIDSLRDNVFSGKIGQDAAEIQIGKGSTETSNEPVSLGAVVVSSNPFTLIPNLIDAASGGTGGTVGIDVDRTDQAFAKVGLTTNAVLELKSKIGDGEYNILQLRIIRNQLTANDRVLLYSVGWDGTCQYWSD